MTIIHNPPAFVKENNLKDLKSVNLNNLLSLDSMFCNSMKVTDILHTCSYKFEDELKIFDSSNYNVAESEKLNFLYLYFISKARVIKHEQLIPFIRAYNIFQSSVLSLKSWEILGRILNNCLNVYADSDLIDICYHLSRIKYIPKNINELEIFWQRILIQSPNWFNNLDKLDDISLIYLLHLSKSKKFEIDYSESVVESIKNSVSILHRSNGFSTVSLLIDTMESNNIFDESLVESSISLLSQVNEKMLSVDENLCVDFVNILWNYGNYKMKYDQAQNCFNKINIYNVRSMSKIIEKKNKKLFAKLTKSLFLLGINKSSLSKLNIDPQKCHPVFEKDVIDSLYSMEFVEDSEKFLLRHSLKKIENLNLPNSIKLFHLLNLCGVDKNFNESLIVISYSENIFKIQNILSGFLTIKSSENYELIVENSGVIIGIVPCEFVDFLYPDSSDIFVQNLSKKYNLIPCYKILKSELTDLSCEIKQKQFIEKYFHVIYN